ncbi:4-hydroxy-2-oxoglutarate aldolase [uncultured Clostridium sp.]|uniref:Putative 4-hydroxy-4-methyl-2-oxoglutarate aldolase n=1 Tax=Muricoprocola aceti TaxID=2981772 RepID=A0ABT2SJ88_9FIRM|nr:RraA family protein [Muricoprocola aceti]MCQ4774715.1 RraA family protein [Lacrimispora saccharolytica]MCU6724584.1 RraA family protein [Muricoprocola aceti]SCH18950.1 4-hydroxy-2-oxoglutarate aldolase [uncultured Clostridium sp.]
MITWKDDNELFAMMKKELYSAVIGDILDKMNYRHQFLPQRIQPMREEMVVAGRAMPVLEADAFEELSDGQNPIMKKNFGLMLEALDDLKENEVYICSGSSPSYALVGELMCTRMKILKAAGAVVNGFHRDTRGILELNFPCFSYGRYAQDQGPRGKVIDYRVPIEMDGVRINPGDIIFGDLDGVLVIPKEVETEVIQKAYEKATGEKMVAEAIRGGMSTVESFAKHGIM